MRQQLTAVARNGFIRPGADPEYADADDGRWMSIDWPSMTRRLKVLGREVNVVDMGGDGPPMLFIHGLGGRWQNWLLNMPDFADTHRVIALDLPGFGDSELPAEDISIQGFAKVVDALCDELDVERPVVVGNSMGGFVGAELAISFPTRVDRLALVAAAGLTTEYYRRQPALTLARLWAVNAAWIGARAHRVVTRPRLRRLTLQFVVRYPEKLSPQLAWELVKGAGKPGFIPALQALLGYSFRDRLEQMDIPVEIVWGRNDLLVPVGDAERFARLIGPNAHYVVFEDTGHLPMLERPSRFNALLREFAAGQKTRESDIEGVSA